MQDMVKKDAIYIWDKREKYSFYFFKQAIIEAPTLYRESFTKDFLLYTFSFETSLAIMLVQKDDQNNEKPIYFMSVSI